jgi:hypothetical protein
VNQAPEFAGVVSSADAYVRKERLGGATLFRRRAGIDGLAMSHVGNRVQFNDGFPIGSVEHLMRIAANLVGFGGFLRDTMNVGPLLHFLLSINRGYDFVCRTLPYGYDGPGCFVRCAPDQVAPFPWAFFRASIACR